MAANLENRLKALLEAFFVEEVKDLKALFEVAGSAAGSFSAKTLLCYSLGLLSKEEKRDLDLIRKIRNDFAHKEHGWNFQMSRIAATSL